MEIRLGDHRVRTHWIRWCGAYLKVRRKLPLAIAKSIRAAVGADKKPLQATIIAGLLQALQGDEKWAKLLWERGYGKVADKLEGGDVPIQHTFTLKFDNS